jgi:hypothetical protein
MATISEFTSVSDKKWFEIITSAPALPGSDTIELENPVSFNLPHCFVGVQQFDAGGLPVLGGGSSRYAISIRTLAAGVFEELPESPVRGNDPRSFNFAANFSAIRVVPANVTGVTTFRLFLTANGN